MYAFSQHLATTQQRVNGFLAQSLNDLPESRLLDAMRYAVLLGGKRIRPFLVYAVGEMLDVTTAALDAPAGAIEAIHAYSLIHDDLPAMDDDNLRRGKPTCHIQFDEATAILAGDALQSFAFELLSKAHHLSAQQKVALMQSLAKNAGANGMCLGQSLDLQGENRTLQLNELEKIHRYKTGALLRCAVQMGFLCSKYADDKTIGDALDTYAKAIGLAFQVQDDILDIESTTEMLGKTVGADINAHKSTYPQLLGLAAAKQKAQELHQVALSALAQLPFDTQVLRAVADFVVQRQN